MLRTAFARLARRPALAMGSLLAAGIAFTALPSLWYGPPLPALHDEFGYLFLGETFARGRLTNDPPPGPPEFYATFHELITPRYEAKFPPGQGVALAAGILLGHPIFGIWMVNGLWAAALYWMLRGAAPPGWSLLGALAAVIGYGAMSYWGQSYWGGSVLALGGTLAFGGALRLWRRRGNTLSNAVWAGLGCGMMALTRPFDGFIFALWPTAIIARSLWRRMRDQRNGRPRAQQDCAPTQSGWVAKTLLAFVIPAVIGVALMLGYNIATTGRALTFAHRLYDGTQMPGLVLFVWDKPAPDPPDQPYFLSHYEHVFSTTLGANPLTARLYWGNLRAFLSTQLRFLFPIWTLPLAAAGLAGIFFARDRTARFALVSLLFLAIPLLTLRFYGFSHYGAAWTAPALLLIMQGARRWRAHWRRAGQSARWLGCLAIFLVVAWPLAATVGEMTRGYPQWEVFPWVAAREEVREKLADRAKTTGRPQLVAVIYTPDHDPHAEWVFNSPDPAAQDVLWLRALGPARVPELSREFPRHDEWLAYVKADGELDHLDAVKLPNVPATPVTTTTPLSSAAK